MFSVTALRMKGGIPGSKMIRVHKIKDPESRYSHIVYRRNRTTVYLERNKPTQMLKDLAGIASSGDRMLSTAPRFVVARPNSESGFGPLAFHHCLYGYGASRPFRPIVVRKVAQGLKWGPSTQLDRHAGAVLLSSVSTFTELPNSSQKDADWLPRLAFAVTDRIGADVLHLPASASAAPKGILSTFRGISEVPPLPKPDVDSAFALPQSWSSTAEGAPELPLVLPDPPEGAAVTSHVETEGILTALRPLVVTVEVPEWAVEEVKEWNAKRGADRALAGLKSRPEGWGAHDQDILEKERVHEIVLTAQDACFVPRGWRYSVALVDDRRSENRAAKEAERLALRKDAEDRGMLPSHSFLKSAAAGPQNPFKMVNGGSGGGPSLLANDNAPGRQKDSGDEPQLCCVRHRFRPFPVLTAEQRARYMPTEYVTSFGNFYTRGGNAIMSK